MEESIKKLNNSREGNDCWISEHWYWIYEFSVAIRLTKVNGWGEEGLKTATFETIDDEMPVEVKGWFK